MNTLASNSDLEIAESGRKRPHALVHEVEVTARPPIDYHAWIAAIAYSFAESRGFEPGHELEDWLKAEKQVQFEIMGEGRTF